jgi:hypothetical protein
MSIRLFHRHARLVIRLPARDGDEVWIALHQRPVAWGGIFVPALALVGIRAEPSEEATLTFAGGKLIWTRETFWTTIRLHLPPSSAKKRALLAMGLLKAARYAQHRAG